jgi:hypothetical protein
MLKIFPKANSSFVTFIWGMLAISAWHIAPEKMCPIQKRSSLLFLHNMYQCGARTFALVNQRSKEVRLNSKDRSDESGYQRLVEGRSGQWSGYFKQLHTVFDLDDVRYQFVFAGPADSSGSRFELRLLCFSPVYFKPHNIPCVVLMMIVQAGM